MRDYWGLYVLQAASSAETNTIIALSHFVASFMQPSQFRYRKNPLKQPPLASSWRSEPTSNNQGLGRTSWFSEPQGLVACSPSWMLDAAPPWVVMSLLKRAYVAFLTRACRQHG
jgi:hypothetical protein